MKVERISGLRAKVRTRLHHHLFKGLFGAHVVYYAGHALHIPGISMGAAAVVLGLMLLAAVIGEEVH